MSKTILITGSAGFIGRALVEKLSRTNLDIIAVYRRKRLHIKKTKKSNITLLRLDLNCKNDFKKIRKKVDAVIHLASHTYRPGQNSSFDEFYNNNVLGTYNLLEFCRASAVKRIIYASTKYVYGSHRIGSVDETCIPEPSGKFFDYGISKLIGEHLCLRYSRDFGLKAIILRLSSVFGPGQEEDLLIPRLINKVKTEKKITLYGNGMNIMEYLYIDDCVNLMVYVIRSKDEGLYNIGPGKEITMKGIMDKIIQVFADKKKLIISYNPAQGRALEEGFILDVNKAKKELNFRPRYSFIQGLNEIKKYKEA